MQAIRLGIIAALKEDRPQSVRHIFYMLCGSPGVPKTEAGYNVIQRELLKLRQIGVVPWAWVSDGTRWRRQDDSFDSPAEAVRWAAETYRRDLWRRTSAYVEVWCESDSIAGVLTHETDRYNVPLMVSRGFSSKTYLYRAAKDIEADGRPAFLYYVGDWDASGKLIPEDIEKTLRGFAPKAEIHFQRLLVTPEQIKQWQLPTKPAKKSTHSANFTGGTVEAEAIPAYRTRQIVRETIEQHLDFREVKVIEAAEASERQHLERVAEMMAAGELA